MRAISLAALLFFFSTTAKAEQITVKYRDTPVDLKTFVCTDTPRSSFIRRACYDQPKTYMVIMLRDTWYHYCGIDAATVKALLTADSAGRYYNANVKGRFDCRMNPVPTYQ